MAKINLRDYLAAISVKTENADLDKITILDSSDNNKIKTILKQDLVDLDAIASQLESEFVRVGGIVSSSDQLISDLDARYLNTFGDSVVSQSSQIDVTQTTNYGSINQYTDSDNLDYLNSINVISQSSQINVTQTTNYGSINQYSDIKVKNKLTAEGVISASSQIVLNDADKEDFSTADVAENASFLYYTDARVKNKLTAENVISSSEQITILESQISDLTHYTDNDVKKKLNNDDVLSGSFKDKLTTENVISSSEQITILESQISDLTHYTDSNVKDKLNAESVISSSEQLGVNDSTITISGSEDGAVLINGVGGGEFTLNQSGDTTFTISLANGLVSGSVIREIPIGTISSSAQIYSTFSGSNLVSSSNQIIISQSQISDLTHYTDSDVLDYINSLAVQSGSDTPHYTDSDVLDYINSIGVQSGSINQYTDSDNTSHLNSLGVISGSSQIDHDQTTNFSADEHFTQANITTVGTVTTGNVDAILPTGTVSGSSQITFNDISENPFISGSEEITASGHFVPSQHETYDLGSSTLRWRDLYLSGSTIDLGGTLIKRGTDGNIRFIDRNTEVVKSIGIDSITGSLSITENLDVSGSITASGLLINGNTTTTGVHFSDGLQHNGNGGTGIYFDTNTVDIWTQGSSTLKADPSGDVYIDSGDLYLSGSSSSPAIYLYGQNTSLSLGGSDNSYVLAQNFDNGYIIQFFQPSYITNKLSNTTNILEYTVPGTGWPQTYDANDGYYNFQVNATNVFQIYKSKTLVKNALEVESSITVSDSITATIISASRLQLEYGDRNILIGSDTGYVIDDRFGVNNIFIGDAAGDALATGDYNVGIGLNALGSISDNTSDANVSIGFGSTQYMDSGSYNVSLGYYAMSQADNADDAIGIGRNALNNGGDYNIGIGYKAGYYLSGVGNIAIGKDVGLGLSSSATYNTGIGRQALGANGTPNQGGGDYNSAFGYQSLKLLRNGNQNTSIGSFAGSSIKDGGANTIMGFNAGLIVKEDGNTIVGAHAGDSIVSGSYNTLLGWSARTNGFDDNNSIVIGKQARGNGSNTVVIGNDDIVSTELKGDVTVSGKLQPQYGTGNHIIIGNSATGQYVTSSIQSQEHIIIGNNAGNSLVKASNNILIGHHAGENLEEGFNLAIGYYSLRNLAKIAQGNTVIGYRAGGHVSGSYNTVLGHGALEHPNLNPSNNYGSQVAIGYNAAENGGHKEQISIGNHAGYKLAGTNTVGNVLIGSWTGKRLGSKAVHNTSIGYYTLGGGTGGSAGLSSGSYNTAIGSQALENLEDGDHNIAIGYRALEALTDGYDNTAVGNDSLKAVTTGYNNVALGKNTAYNLTTGTENTVLGEFAGSTMISASKNVVIGTNSGVFLRSGEGNVVIGHGARISASLDDTVPVTNSIVIGGDISTPTVGNGSNTVVIGNNYIVSTELKGDVTASGLLINGDVQFETVSIDYPGNPTTNTEYGTLNFQSNNGVGGKIKTIAQNLHSGTNLGTRLKFDTCTTNATTLTTKHQITSDGYTKITSNGTHYNQDLLAHEIYSAENNEIIEIVNGISGSSVGGGLTVRYSGYAPNNTSQTFFRGRDTVGHKIYIYSNGDIQNSNNAYGAISDIKVKENIVDATPKLDDLMQVQVRNYNLIGSDKKQIGVVAQELESIFPNMISETPDVEDREIVDENGNTSIQKVDLGTVTKSVNYSVFTPMLIKAIQEQQSIIDDLKSRIEALENQ